MRLKRRAARAPHDTHSTPAHLHGADDDHGVRGQHPHAVEGANHVQRDPALQGGVAAKAAARASANMPCRGQVRHQPSRETGSGASLKSRARSSTHPAGHPAGGQPSQCAQHPPAGHPADRQPYACAQHPPRRSSWSAGRRRAPGCPPRSSSQSGCAQPPAGGEGWEGGGGAAVSLGVHVRCALGFSGSTCTPVAVGDPCCAHPQCGQHTGQRASPAAWTRACPACPPWTG